MSIASNVPRSGVQRAWRLLCTLLLFCPPLLVSQPKATVVGGLSFDFGTLYSTMKVKRLITIRNEGTDTLRVDEVSTSCGCTAALLSRPLIAPRDSGTVEISFDPRKFTGAVEKGVSMKTNDPSNPKAHIVFTANVVKLLEVEPEYMIYRAMVGQPATEQITLTNMSAEPIRIVSVTSSSPLVAFGEFIRELLPNQPAGIAVTLTPTKSGAQNGDIVIATDNPDVPSLTIRFFALAKDTARPAAAPDSGR